MGTDAKQTLAMNAVRILSIDGVQAANSGHPGLPLGAAPMAFELWANHLRHNPADPKWINRDRFVLSAGHGSMLVYSLLHLFGYGLTIDDLKAFRSYDSLTPGHPEYGHTIGVEATTGPLGQGIAMSVGIALAEAHLADRLNKPGYPIIDHYTYTIVGDGCLQEGVASEASSLAATLKLGKLIAFYDSNNITIDGATDLAFTEDVAARYRAYGWQVLEVMDANDMAAIGKAIEEAKLDKTRPTLIVVHSVIGYGSPMAGSEKTHGSPLGAENIAATRKALNWPLEEAFAVPDEVYSYIDDIKNELLEPYAAWNKLLDQYKAEFPEQAALYEQLTADRVELVDDEAFYAFEGKIATRKTSETVINRVAAQLPNWLGGSADLAASNLTNIKDESFISPADYSGRNIHFGVREFGMAAVTNGLALHSGLRPYCATFLIFSDYMKAATRLSALMQVPVTYVFTHDSIGVGEDGPTHEPIEQLAMLRATPGLYVFRPADGPETAAAYAFAVNQQKPVAMALSRQNLPTLDGSGPKAKKGAYVLRDAELGEGELPEIILLASGSEVFKAVEAFDQLVAEGVKARVVSVPSMALFLEQDASYQESVLPKAVRKRVAMEAAATQPWYRFVGLDGIVIGIDRFGASAPGDVIFEKLGLTTEKFVEAAKSLL